MLNSERRTLNVGLVVVAAFLWMASGGAIGAAEFRLRPECRCAKAVVTLGDVADVLAADPGQVQSLSAIELFPLPPPGNQRYLGARELQDLLFLRGVNLIGHRFSGSSQVTILGPSPADRPAPPKALSGPVMERAQRSVADAILRHLKEHAAPGRAWQVDVKLSEEDAKLLAAAREVSASGGEEPFVGEQVFEVVAASAGRTARLAVNAQVSPAAAVVVAARSIPSGAVISAADVTLTSGQPANAAGEPFASVEEVVGLQATRLIPADKVVDRDAVRAPVLVHRGEVVTVYSRRPGIQVKVIARARDEGSLGQLVAVENLAERKSFLARVTGVAEAEVDVSPAQSAAARPAAVAGTSGNRARSW
jgi:flagella basal body P-ring formation protein FlgA